MNRSIPAILPVKKKVCTISIINNANTIISWKIDVAACHSVSHKRANWLIEFAARFHVKVLTEWLVPALHLKKMPSVATGVELWIMRNKTERMFGIFVSDSGKVCYTPSDSERVVCITKEFLSLIETGTASMSVSLMQDDGSTWGGMLLKCLQTNKETRGAILQNVLHSLGPEKLYEWCNKQRAANDPDTHQCVVAITKDALLFLTKYPGPYLATDYKLWSNFINLVEGATPLTVDCLQFAFLPKSARVGDHDTRSDLMDLLMCAFEGGQSETIPCLVSLLRQTIVKLQIPVICPISFFKECGFRVACASGTATKYLAHVEDRALFLEYFVQEDNMERVRLVAMRAGLDVKLLSVTERACVNGAVTRITSWSIDSVVRVMFISGQAMINFNYHLHETPFWCCFYGEMFVHVIALIIRARQTDNGLEVRLLSKGLSVLSKKVERPVIGNETVVRKKLYFSDYNKRFVFGKRWYIPEQCLPIPYTKHMHLNLQLFDLPYSKMINGSGALGYQFVD
jgi:hypothetical protein